MNEESLVMVIHLLYRAVVAGGVILNEGLVRLSVLFFYSFCSIFLARLIITHIYLFLPRNVSKKIGGTE